MTREEFDVWIGQNRKRLIRVAWKIVGKFDAEDAVQNAILSILENETYLKVTHKKNLVSFFAQTVRQRAFHARRSRARAAAAVPEIKILDAGALRSESSKRKPTMDQQEGGPR